MTIRILDLHAHDSDGGNSDIQKKIMNNVEEFQSITEKKVDCNFEKSKGRAFLEFNY